MIKKIKSKSEKIIILGAGLAGLAAGYELANNGKNVVIIEKWDDVGGLARTLKVGKFLFDTGPHRWYTKNDMVNEWMLNLLKGEVIKVPRLTRIYFDKKFFYYPIKFKNVLTGIGIGKSLQAMVDYFYARIVGRFFSPKLVNMEDGYINQFGKTLYETFFKRYSEKLWGQDCRNISVDWVGQRTRGLSILTILKDAIFKSKNVVSLVDEFSYPDMGVGRIAYKLRDGIIKKGGTIILNADVTKIISKHDEVVSVEYSSGKNTEIISGDLFISSIPINDLVFRFFPKTEKKVLELGKKLKYRDELQVALFIKKTHVTPDTWVYVHPKKLSFMRFMEMDNWSDKLSPKGQTSLVFEIACNEGDSMWNKKDEDIIALVKKQFVEEFGLLSNSDVLGGYVHRVPKEYPVYHVGYKEDVDRIKEFFSHYKNLQLIGRNGTFRYNNMDHSIEMGLYSAWNIIHGSKKYDIDSVNIEREYLEEKKIENIEDEIIEESH